MDTFTNHAWPISYHFSLRMRSISSLCGNNYNGLHLFFGKERNKKFSLFSRAPVEDTQTILGYMEILNGIIVILAPHADVANPILS
jgi:hypothetical protein